jgi:hypothetical protein
VDPVDWRRIAMFDYRTRPGAAQSSFFWTDSRTLNGRTAVGLRPGMESPVRLRRAMGAAVHGLGSASLRKNALRARCSIETLHTNLHSVSTDRAFPLSESPERGIRLSVLHLESLVRPKWKPEVPFL